MKIAFDVKGTIDGPRGKIILEAFRKLQELGHECIVWSNSLGYAHDAVKSHGLNADFMSKKMMLDYDSEDEAMDVAIEDDRSQTWLGAKRFIFVDEITNNSDALVRNILEGVSNDTTKV